VFVREIDIAEEIAVLVRDMQQVVPATCSRRGQDLHSHTRMFIRQVALSKF
jgi:hypothetical protein